MRRNLLATTIAAAAILGATGAAAKDNTGKKFQVSLSGLNNIEGGDPDGRGTATVRINPGQQQLCYSLSVRNIDPATAAHIHEAPAGSTGPVVVGLQPPTSGMSSGCLSITRELALELIRSPEDYYINVHNPAYPAGAVRGQLGM